MPFQMGSGSKKIGTYIFLIVIAAVAWNVVWVGMSTGFYGVDDAVDFEAQDITLGNIDNVNLFQTDVIRKVPHNTGEIRLRANRFGWADVVNTDPLYENGKLVWRAVIEPKGLINQLTKSAPAVAETSAEIESSPTVIEKDLKYSEAKLFTQFSMRRAWYANRFLLVDDGYITTGADGSYWWVYPRIGIKWFLFTYKKEFRGVTLVSAESSEI